MAIENLGQLISHFAKQARVPDNAQYLIDVLNDAELTKRSLNPELVKQLTENILGVEDAIDNHPKVKQVYKKSLLGTIDEDLNAGINRLPISDDEKQALLNNQNTFERIRQYQAKVEEVNQKAVAAAAKGKDTEPLQKEIERLNSDLRNAKEAAAKAVQDGVQALENYKQDELYNGTVANLEGRKTVWDSLPENLRKQTLRSLLDDRLKKEGVTLEWKDGKPEMMKDGAKYFNPKTNLPYTLADVRDIAIDEAKGFQTTPTPPAQTNGYTPLGTIVPGYGNQQQGQQTNQTASDNFLNSFYGQQSEAAKQNVAAEQN